MDLWTGEEYTKPEQALEYLNAAIQLDSEYADAYHKRGLAYHNFGRYEKAIEDYDHAIASGKHLSVALVDLDHFGTVNKQHGWPTGDKVLRSVAEPLDPMEETVWAMSDMVSSGRALYWGTSEWAADEIRHAIDIAERHHLHKPVTEQSTGERYDIALADIKRARLEPEL